MGELCGFGAFFFFFAPYWKKNRYFLSKLCTQQQTRVWEHVSLIFSNFMPSQENAPNGIFPIICGLDWVPLKKDILLCKFIDNCLKVLAVTKVKFTIDRSNSHKKLPKVFRKVCKFTITIVCKTEEFCCLCTLSETLWAIFCVNWIDQF